MKSHNVVQGSEEWLQIRKGKLSGTVLKSIMGTPKARKEAIYEMVAERLTVGVQSDYESPIDRGHRLEGEAAAAFEFETGKKTEVVGFCEDDNDPLICNSPDRLIGENEALEIKCMGGKNHVKMWLTDQVPEEYDWQCVQYFVVNPKLETLYFAGYNPDIPTHPLHIITVKRADLMDKIDEARAAQQDFLKEVNEELSKVIKL
jgi:putative phage-type endonuclease